MPIDCFDKHAPRELAERFNERVKAANAMENEAMQREIGRELVNEFHKEIHTELNALKKLVGLKPDEYKSLSESEKVKKVNEEYDTLIANKKIELENAIQEPTTNEVDVRQQTRDGEGMGERNIQSEIPAEESKGTGEEKEMTGIRHASTAEVRKKYGLGEYERKNATDAELEAKADEVIKKGYDPENLVRQMEEGTPPSGVENFILKKYLSTLQATFDKNPTDANLAPIERLLKATDRIGSLQSEAFRTRKGVTDVDDSLAGFFIEQKEASSVDELTPTQKLVNQKEFEEINAAKKDYEERLAKAEAENARLRAEAEFNKTKSTSKKSAKKDYAEEREKIIGDIREKLRKARGETSATIVPYAKELIAIAPDVARLAKNLIEDGVTQLADVVKNIHGQLKDDIEGITEKDVHDILAGEYKEPKKTKDEYAAKLRELKTEAALVNKLAKLEAGEKPKNEKAKVEHNRQVKELREKIGEHDLTRLAQRKSRIEGEIKKVQEQLRTGDFEVKKPAPLKLDKETIAARDKLLLLKEEREIRLLKDEYAKRTLIEKSGDVFTKAWNTPKAILGTADVSFPFRQGIWNISRKLLSNPISSKGLFYGQRDLVKDFGKMYAALGNEAVYRRMMADIIEHPQFERAKKAGLAITDVNSPLARAREEIYGPNYAEKIPILGKSVKLTGDVKVGIGGQKIPFTKKYLPRAEAKLGNLGDKGVKIPFTDKRLKTVGGIVKSSERAFTAMGMIQRWNHFNEFADAMEKRGLTMEKDPQAFKEAAIYANQASGVGNLGEGVLKSANGFLSKIIWSTKLAASRLQLLTKWANVQKFWHKVPKEVRVAYLQDMVKFVAMGTSILAMAKAMGLSVELDPRSSDFGSIKVGDTRYDIWGGMKQWVTMVARMISGETKTTSGEVVPLGSGYGETSKGDIAMRFIRGKATPEVGAIYNSMEGKNIIGEKTDASKEMLKMVSPLIAQDLNKALEDKSTQNALLTAILTSHGIGVSEYKSADQEDNEPVDWSTLYAEVVDSKTTHSGHDLQVKDPKTREERKMTKGELETFQTKRDAYIKEALDELKKNGLPYVEKGAIKVTPYDKITVAQMRDELKKIKSGATRNIKDEMFPELESEKRQETINEKILDRYKKHQQ